MSAFPRPPELFQHCPKCGATLGRTNAMPLLCASCGFTYYFNPSVAAAAYLFDEQHRCLFIRRAKEPAQGKLAVPGGFIDYDETAEVALKREVLEEVGLAIHSIRYLGSCTNNYAYRGVTYPVVDLIFTAQAVAPEQAQALDGVAGVEWKLIEEVNPDDLAFPSLKMGWHLLQQLNVEQAKR